MSYSDKDSSEVVECLVDTLTIEGNPIHETNLSNLCSSELEQLAELSQNMTEMEAQEFDELTPEDQVEEVVQTEFGAEEIEIETITAEEVMAETKSRTAIPPLQPLSIAPKPTKNVPIAIKPVTTQQLLLVQGIGGSQVKLLSTQGQEVNLSNIQIAKPVTLKPAVKTITNQRHTLPILQPKQVVMKKLLTPVPKVALPKTESKPGQIVVVQKSDAQQVTLLQAPASSSNSTKTITLAQAQQMGFKLIPQVTTPKPTIMLNKAPKTVKIVPQVKSQTKILPAPQSGDTNKVAQRIFIKPANASPLIASSQLIQVTGGQAQALQSGQLHQIQIPGKGVQYIKFVTTTSQNDTASTPNLTTISSSNSVTGKIVPLTTLTSVKGSNILINADNKKQIKTTFTPKTIKTAPTLRPATVGNTTNPPQLLMVPASYLNQQQQQQQQQTSNTSKVLPIQSTLTKISPAPNETAVPEPNIEPNGMRPRKPCNCTKSQCLKLYCDCFANGEFCYMCNCMNCFNNLDNEEHRNRAIKNCLERNPNAFRPKIGKSKDTGDSTVRKHTKGCNCKRSGCLKNYCECYEAKIACSSNCKCLGCRNLEDSMEKKNLKPQLNVSLGLKNPLSVTPVMSNLDNIHQFRPKKLNNKQAFTFVTNNVIEATCQCLISLAQSEEVTLKNDKTYTEKLIVEEFGRCLQDIVACSLKISDNFN